MKEKFGDFNGRAIYRLAREKISGWIGAGSVASEKNEKMRYLTTWRRQFYAAGAFRTVGVRTSGCRIFPREGANGRGLDSRGDLRSG